MGQVDARFIGNRIQEERKLAGLSQEELGKSASLERTVITKIEHGTRKVSALELSDIAAAIGVRMTDFFQSPTPALVSHRSSQGLDVADSGIDRLIAQLAREVEFVSKMATVPLGLVHGDAMNDFELAPPASAADAETLAAKARKLMKVSSDEPLTSLVTQAASIGLLAFSRNIGNDTADAGTVLLQQGGVSLINSHMKVGRRRLALAHELGHYLIADDYTVDWRVASPVSQNSSLETRLDRFARALLLPKTALQSRWNDDASDDERRTTAIKLASLFRVDMATLARRLVELELTNFDQEVREYRTRQSDILELGLLVPIEELTGTSVPESYAKAVLQLVRDERISRERALELLQGTFAEEDLPPTRVRRSEEIWNFVS